jgi:hypothetical protein
MTGAPLTIAVWKEHEGLPVVIAPAGDGLGALRRRHAS